jgi:tRNA(fMet)-specific endonuclease VapC
MPKRYLLDTNILTVLMDDPDGHVAAKVASVIAAREIVCTSIIVAAESRFGVAKKGSDRLRRKVEELLAEIDVLPLEPNADEYYAELRADLEHKGRLIGGNDMFIAAHALATDSILVTNNVREFSRVKGLRIENWLAEPTTAH